jgi:hypothetical protein
LEEAAKDVEASPSPSPEATADDLTREAAPTTAGSGEEEQNSSSSVHYFPNVVVVYDK